MEMVDSMMEQLQPDVYVAIAPEIVDNNNTIVAHEPREHHSKVQMHHKLVAEATAEPRNNGILLVSRREQCESFEYDKIQPEFMAWRHGSLEDALAICSEWLRCVVVAKPLATMATAAQVVGVSLMTRREQFRLPEEPWVRPDLSSWRPGSLENALTPCNDWLWCVVVRKPLATMTTAAQVMGILLMTRREQFRRPEEPWVRPDLSSWRLGSLEDALTI